MRRVAQPAHALLLCKVPEAGYASEQALFSPGDDDAAPHAVINYKGRVEGYDELQREHNARNQVHDAGPARQYTPAGELVAWHGVEPCS